MELRHLEALDAVLREGTFAAAAKKRHLTQPALWAQVKSLEDELGVTLFRRQGRGVVPTGACLELAPRVRAVLAEASSVVGLAAAIRQGTAAPARVGCASHHVAHFVAPCVARLVRDHPETPVPIIVTGTGAGSALEGLATGVLDLLVYSTPPRADAQGVRLFPTYAALVGPLATAPTIDLAALDGVPVVVPPAHSNTRRALERAMAAAGVRPRIVNEVAEATALLAYAQHGLANALMPSECVPDGTPWSRVEVAGVPLARSIWLHWCDAVGLSPAARLLRDTMRAFAAERVAADTRGAPEPPPI